MYFNLINSLKRRLVLELQDSFSAHPVYNKITPFIQNRFAFTERPQFGIVIKGSSANQVTLSADNFLGSVMSYVMLANVGAPVFPLEWVKEDLRCIQANGDVMPTPPGVYFIEILTAPENAQDEGTFIIDPLLTVSDEAVLRFVSGVETEGQLQQLPVQGTLKLWENRRFLLQEGYHYTVDYATGSITFLDRSAPGSVVTADYRYSIASVGPISYQWNKADFSTLPGVVLAFGKRGKAGDKVAVVVYEDRVEAAKAFGGRFDVTFEMDVLSRDAIQTEEIADMSLMYLMAQKRDRLSSEGIEVTSVSIGGESEEVTDETGEEFTYMASVSVQFQSDWEVHIPLPLTTTRVTATTPEGDKAAATLDAQQNTTIIADVQNSLMFSTLPVIAGRNNNFERIL